MHISSLKKQSKLFLQFFFKYQTFLLANCWVRGTWQPHVHQLNLVNNGRNVCHINNMSVHVCMCTRQTNEVKHRETLCYIKHYLIVFNWFLVQHSPKTDGGCWRLQLRSHFGRQSSHSGVCCSCGHSVSVKWWDGEEDERGQNGSQWTGWVHNNVFSSFVWV